MRKLFAILALALGCTAASHAQFVSVYGTFSPTHLTNVYTGCTGSACTPQYTSFWASGVGGGATVNIINLHVVKLGFDLRGSTKPGTSGADTAEFGLRLGAQPPLLRIKPYIEGTVGYLNTRSPNQSTSGSGAAVGGTYDAKYATYNVHAGLDVPVFPFVDLRVVELGYGHAFADAGGVSFNGHTMPNLFTVNSGLVVHF